jgi:hypothetical protein
MFMEGKEIQIEPINETLPSAPFAIFFSDDATGSGSTRQDETGSQRVSATPLNEVPTATIHYCFSICRIIRSAAIGLRARYVPWYIGTTMRTYKHHKHFVVERVQTGVRIEKRLLKVLKALAEYHDLTLGDLLEGIVLHAFDGKTAFQKPSRRQIKELKKFYGLDLDFRASHRLIEARAAAQKPKSEMPRRARTSKLGRRSKKAKRSK